MHLSYNLIENNLNQNYGTWIELNCITAKEVYVIALILCDIKQTRTARDFGVFNFLFRFVLINGKLHAFGCVHVCSRLRIKDIEIGILKELKHEKSIWQNKVSMATLTAESANQQKQKPSVSRVMISQLITATQLIWVN